MNDRMLEWMNEPIHSNFHSIILKSRPEYDLILTEL